MNLDEQIFELIRLKGVDSEKWADGKYSRSCVLRGTGLRITQIIRGDVISFTSVDHTTRWLYSARWATPKDCKREQYFAGDWENDIARQLEIARYDSRQGQLFPN